MYNYVKQKKFLLKLQTFLTLNYRSNLKSAGKTKRSVLSYETSAPSTVLSPSSCPASLKTRSSSSPAVHLISSLPGQAQHVFFRLHSPPLWQVRFFVKQEETAPTRGLRKRGKYRLTLSAERVRRSWEEGLEGETTRPDTDQSTPTILELRKNERGK